MLIELYGRNFGCFRDEFRLSMLATDIDRKSSRGIAEVHVEGDDEPLRLLRTIALYGPNASGKSTVLRAAGALRKLLRVTGRLSSDSPLPSYEPFALGPQAHEPVMLGAKAVIDGGVYEYAVEYTEKAFVSEQLKRLMPDGRPQVLIDRRGRDVDGTWKMDPKFELIASDFRSNALFLSLADSLLPGLARGIASGLRRLLRHSDPLAGPLPGFFSAVNAAERVHEDEEFGEWLVQGLRVADVGVVDIRLEEIRPGDEADLYEYLRLKMLASVGKEDGASPRRSRRSPRRLRLLHEGEGGPMPLPYGSESLGTKRFVEWAPLIYDLTHATSPRAAFVDELDASMHPLLLRAIVQHFNCFAPTSSVRGQLIFTTHETTLLDDEAKDAVLRRDQVYLTAKDATGASSLYSVAEFRERNNLNVRRRYLQGRYGALPSLGSFAE